MVFRNQNVVGIHVFCDEYYPMFVNVMRMVSVKASFVFRISCQVLASLQHPRNFRLVPKTELCNIFTSVTHNSLFR
jgi:hypothetical protein